MMERRREPNKGLFSPPGGKLRIDEGESPHACACREAPEERGLDLGAAGCRPGGMVGAHGEDGPAPGNLAASPLPPALGHRERRRKFIDLLTREQPVLPLRWLRLGWMPEYLVY